MRIQYLGHSCFRIISGMGTAVVTDPYDGDMVGFEMPSVSADIVTVSHRHRDHDCVDGLLGSPAVLEKDVRLAADDITVQSMLTYHDDQHGKLRGTNYVFLFVVDGLRVAHMGDVGFFDAELVSKLYGCDVLMLPVGGVYTVDAKDAKKYVDAINPKIVLPMHYATPQHKFRLESLEKFTALFDSMYVQYKHTETLTVDDHPQNSRPKVVVLNKYED